MAGEKLSSGKAGRQEFPKKCGTVLRSVSSAAVKMVKLFPGGLGGFLKE
jgi:hypothetical protein